MARWVVGQIGFVPPITPGWFGPYTPALTYPFSHLVSIDDGGTRRWAGLEIDPGTIEGNVWVSTDDGVTWTNEGNPLGSGHVCSFLGAANDRFFAGGEAGDFIATGTDGSSWALVASPFTPLVDGFISNVSFGAGVYIVTSFTTHATSVTPASSWTLETRLGSSFLLTSAFVADRFLIKQNNGAGNVRLWVDSDGAAPWTQVNNAPDNTQSGWHWAELRQFSPPRIAGVATVPGPHPRKSLNRGLLWTDAGTVSTIEEATKALSLLAVERAAFVLGGVELFLWWTDDGDTYSTTDPLPSGSFINAAAAGYDGDDLVLACNDAGEIYGTHPSTW